MEPGDTSAWKELPFLAEGLLTVVGEVRRTLSYNGTVDIGACGLMLSSSTFQSVGTNHGCSRLASSFTPRGDIRGYTAGNEGDRRAFR